MRRLWRRIDALLHWSKRERELEEDMAAHREMLPGQFQNSFGNSLRLREEAKDAWGWTWLDHLRQDLQYGARGFLRSPGYTITAISILALGIGVNLAEIHMFNAVLHRLQVRDLDSLCRFFRIGKERRGSGFSIPAIDYYREYNTVLSAVIAETDVPRVYLAGDPAQLRCSMVSGNFFGELGVAPLYGRMLDEQDAKPGAPAVAVLGYGYWQSRFGGDPGIVMQTIRLNEKSVQVVGIAPPEFGGLGQQRVFVWLPVIQHPYITGSNGFLTDFSIQRSFLFGRLKPGIPIEAAEAQVQSLTEELKKRQPKYFEGEERLQLTAADAIPSPSPQMVLMVSAWGLLVLLVLISSCANLGNMLLARGLARQREFDIRLSVGAGRGRLVRQLMTENVLLAAIASVAALLVGRFAARVLFQVTEAPPDLRVVTDWRIVSACALLGLLATVSFGLAPAFQAVSRGKKTTRARRALVGVQVTVSCVLLILSSLFTRSIVRSQAVAANFDYQRMVVVDPGFYMHQTSGAEALRAIRELAVRLQRAPGVDTAGAALNTPLGGRSRMLQLSGKQLEWNAVEPSFFATMHLPLTQGRMFLPSERRVALVSESAARQLWPRESPLGKTCLIGPDLRTVVGVTGNSGTSFLGEPEEVYTPLEEADAPYATVLVHVTDNPANRLMAIRSAASLPGVVPLVSTLTNSQHFEAIKKTLTIVGSLGAVASWVAMIGIFGLVAFTVSQRTKEIGLRMALGARRRDVLLIVFGQFLLPFGLGAAASVGIAAIVTRMMAAAMFGIAELDFIGYGAGLLLFLVIACAASLLPARRALRIDPATALRYE